MVPDSLALTGVDAHYDPNPGAHCQADGGSSYREDGANQSSCSCGCRHLRACPDRGGFPHPRLPFACGKFRVLFSVSFVGFLVLTAVGQADPENKEAASCRASESGRAGVGLLVVSPSQGLSCGGVEGVSLLFSSVGCFALLF